MESLREFLETSTVHGLAYLSTSKSRAAKTIWAILIVAAFSSAGYLIWQSYVGWSKSPVSTTISTHPIAELDFPKVTVCPPEGSDTAFNYDLIKSANKTLSPDIRETLDNAINDIFIYGPGDKFANEMKAATNPENMRNVYLGMQSYPRSYYGDGDGFLVKQFGRQGRITSPFFGQDFNSSNYFNPGDTNMYSIEFADDIVDTLGNGTVVVEIDFTTSLTTGYTETLLYAGPNFESRTSHSYVYTITRTALSWEDAEAYCVNQGGNLASVETKKELQEIGKLMDSNTRKKLWWLGGSDSQVEGSWTWSSGAKWGFTNWETEYGFDGNGGTRANCLAINSIKLTWRDLSCASWKKMRFICKIRTTELNETAKISLKYTRDQFSISKFQLWWKYDFADVTILESLNLEKMTGFDLRWYIKKESTDPDILNSLPSPTTPPGNQEYVIKVINLIERAQRNKMTNEQIKTKIKTFKLKQISVINKQVTYCFDNHINEKFITLLDGVFEHFNTTANATKIANVSDSTIELGFQMFSQLLSCDIYMIRMMMFQKQLVSKYTTGTILLVTASQAIGSKYIYRYQRAYVQQLYRIIDSLLKPGLGKLAFAMLSQSEIDTKRSRNRPIFGRFDHDVNSCLDSGDCEAVEKWLADLGKSDWMCRNQDAFVQELSQTWRR